MVQASFLRFFSLIFVPFLRDHGFYVGFVPCSREQVYCGSNSLVFRAEETDPVIDLPVFYSLSLPWIGLPGDYIRLSGVSLGGVLTKSGLPTQKGVSPSWTQKRVANAGSFVPAGLRGVLSSGNHVSRDFNNTNDSIDAAVAIAGVVGIASNAELGCRRISEAAGVVTDVAVKADLGAISDLQRTTTLISAPDQSERGVRP